MKYTDNKNSKPDTRQQILTYIQNSDMTSPADINTQFDINRQMIHRHLKKLVEMGFIKKIGSAPKVFYTAITDDTTISDYQINTDTKSIVDKNFFFIEPAGTELSGINGFEKWCNKRNFDISKKAEEFKKVIEKYQKKKDNDLLDASKKMNTTFGENCCVDKLFYFDFYAVEIFGKTKMGQKLLYAKQGEDRSKMKEIAASIKPAIVKMIKSQNIDSVVFVPPTVPRQIQFMKVLESELSLSLAKIEVLKVIGDVRVPQKTLKKIEDRIENAQNTFIVNNKAKFKTTLIIDDAVGSGASI
ncbi:MAG: winged helix-turn-helix transcriptional regulator, partial [Candidatus Ruthia sp.]|nr:winged helix-turn-helix transcriptional regulator [Candidatus Ruthturnera sp.]